MAFWLITKLKCAMRFNEKNNDTKDYSEKLEFLNSEPYYASKKIVNQLSDFPVRRTGSYRHKKALHKQTDDGRVVYITYMQTTCCGDIF